jgi:hypothetical protein
MCVFKEANVPPHRTRAVCGVRVEAVVILFILLCFYVVFCRVLQVDLYI